MKKTLRVAMQMVLLVTLVSMVALGATVTTTGSGNWSSTTADAPWPGGTVPATTDNVIIADGHTVTINQGVTVVDLTVGGGTSGVLTFDYTARAVTINGNLTVAAGGTFITQSLFTPTGDVALTTTISNVSSTAGLAIGMAISGTGIPAGATIAGFDATTITLSAAGTAAGTGVTLSIGGTTHTLAISGNITNNGTIDMSRLVGFNAYAVCNVTFNNTSVDQLVTGTTPVMTRFRGVTLSKGTVGKRVVCDIDVSKSGSGVFLLTAGTWEQTAGTLTFSNGNENTFPITGGLKITGAGSFTTPGASLGSATPYVQGNILVNTSGTFTVGSGNNTLGIGTTGTLTLTSGTVTVNGKILLSAGTTLINGANVIINQQTASTGNNAFDVSATANLTFSSGTVTIGTPNPGATRSGRDIKIAVPTTNTINLVGSTFIMGDGNNSPVSAGLGYFISVSSPVALDNLIIQGAGAADRNTLLQVNLTVNGTLTMKSGTLNLNTKTLTYGASSTLVYNGTSAQTTSDAEFPASGGPKNLTINNAAGVTLHASRTLGGTLALTSGTLSPSVYTFTLNYSPSSYANMNAAIAVVPDGSIVQLAAVDYTDNVVVNKKLTLKGVGATSVIKPSSGIGVSVSANDVTLQDFKVTGTGDHGISAASVSNLTVTNVEASGNGLLSNRSGIALRGVTGTTVLTNVTATGNKKHGLEIGNGSSGIIVTGGTFNSNGVAGDESTGGGIILYSDAVGLSNEVTNIQFHGTLTASNNNTAGIYIYATPGKVNGTSIGQTGGDVITLADNGSSTVQKAGGAGVLLFGSADNTAITATFTRTTAPSGAVVLLGIDAAGTTPPTNTAISNCTFTGYDGNYRIVIFDTDDGTYKADPNTANVIPTGTGSTPPFVIYVMAGSDGNSGETIPLAKATINGGIAAAGGGTTVYINDPSNTVRGTEVVNVNKKIVLASNGPSNTILNKMLTISSSDARVIGLSVTSSPSHGIWANGVANVVIQNIAAYSNTQSGIALRGVTGNSKVREVWATNNSKHGLEIGNGSVGVLVDGGTFNKNGTVDDISTGGGIILYSDASGVPDEVQNTVIKGSMSADSNKTAGIYIYSTPGLVTGTSIGQTGSTILSDNGSVDVVNGTGGAGVLVYGAASSSTISATFKRTTVVGGGLVALGTDGTGSSSPTSTTIQNSTFTGYASGSPAITLATSTMPGASRICTTAITATTNVTFTGASSSSAINALIYDQKDDATLGLVSYTAAAMAVKVKVFLQGPFSSSVMTTALNTAGLIPTNSNTAYNATTYGYTAETVGAIPNANVVDWVLVELRTGTAAGTKVETQPAFLLKDGSIVDIDGSSDVAFSTATAGDYYIVIRHRNHLAVMSKLVVSLPNLSVYDFTTSGQAYGATTPMATVATGVFGMWCGDTDASGVVDLDDRGNTWNNRNQTNVYSGSDTNQSGVIDLDDRGNTWNNRNIVGQVPN